MTQQEQAIVIRIIVSVLAGAVIGAEREYRSKSAGFRTLILICMGSCLFTILSTFINTTEPERIAVGIVSGIGFLGAGVIFKSDNKVTGLTTAATIWITAAVGMAVGGGYYIYAGVAWVLALLVLVLFTKLENLIDKMNQIRNYKIVCKYTEQELKHYEERFKEYSLKFKRGAQSRTDDKLSGVWIVQGSEKNHEKFIAETLNDAAVLDFEF